MGKRLREAYLLGVWEQNPTWCRTLLLRDGHGATEIQDRIDRLFGWRSGRVWNRCRPRSGARPRMPRGFYRKNASRILEEISGFPETRFWVEPNFKLPPSREWLLNRLLYLQENAPLAYNEIYFLRAVARDAGVWPAPGWWRAHRRIRQASTRPTR